MIDRISYQSAIGLVRRAHRLVAVACVAGAMLFAWPASAPAQQVVVLVNGTPITSYDIEQRTRLEHLSTHKTPTRQEVIDLLINDRVKLNEAKRFGIDISDSDVDNAFAGMASNMGLKPPQLVQALASQGVSPAALKARIRADMAWSNLVRGRYQSSLQIGESDIQAMLDKQRDGKDTVGYEYSLRPILFIVAKGAPEATIEARRREAESLRNRFQSCDEGIAFARNLRDVAIRDPIVRNSAELPPPLRTVLDDLAVGRLTAPEMTPQGIQLFALCDKKSSKADSPKKQELRQEIFTKRYEAQSKRYLDQVRRSAMIEYK